MQTVLYVIDTLQTGGAERSTLEIASRLRHYQPVVCQVYQKDELSSSYAGSQIKFENLGLTGKYQFKKAISLLRGTIRKHKPALVIGTLMRAEIIARIACKLEAVPILGTFVNDTYAPEALNEIPASLRTKIRFFQLINSFTAKYCKAFIANSEAIKQSNAKALNIDHQKIVVIHRGRDVAKFDGDVSRKITAPFHFINVGRLLERKGQLDLIRAFHLYDQHYPGSKLSIAGEGPFRKALEAEIEMKQMSENVALVGNIKDVPAFLASADCFIFPSHYEGFSGALLEAALSGIPVIASDISMNKEVIGDGGCLYFRMKDVQDMTDKMIAFSAAAGEYKVRAATEKVKAIRLFNIDHIVAQHEEIYTKCSLKEERQPA